MNEIFKDLIVLELASVLAGPAVGMFFAELGAKVVKFENIKTGGDITRQWKLENEKEDVPYSAYYCSVNYGKEIVMSDLSAKSDKEQLLKWIKKADVIIANFKSESAKRMGLDFESLKLIKEDLIYAQLNGYPDKEKVAFDVVLQAETGFLSMSGTEKGHAAKMPVALIDLMAAHQLKEGILIALLKKYKTGEGSFVVSSLYESAISSLANQATNWLMNNVIPKRKGTIHPNIAPYGEIFKTSDDKEIVLAVGTDKQFENLCVLLNCSEISKDVKYVSNTNRVKNRKTLFNLLSDKIETITCKDFLSKTIEFKVPAGKVNNLKAVFEDRIADQMIIEDEDAEGRVRKRVRTVAFRLK